MWGVVSMPPAAWEYILMKTDLYTIPVVIYPRTYVLAALGGILFILAAHLVTARGIGRLDLAEALKNRD